MLEPDLLSILVPAYNEEQFVATLLKKVLQAELPGSLRREIIVVDDCSTDRTGEIVRHFADVYPNVVRYFRQEKNGGKGTAIATAVQYATGAYSIIQDADLEYDPSEYPLLLRPLLDNRADAVFGSRFAASHERRVLYFWHSVANKMLTLACNIVSDLNLTDMETCYKAVRTSLLQSIPLRSTRFGIEPEITLKLARRRARIYEVPISYNGRTYEEGKKIGLKDAFEAIFTILRYAWSSDLYSDRGQRILHVFSEATRFNRWMADTVRPYLGEDILEIGAGMGNLTRQLAPRRHRYVAVDLDREHLSRLNRALGNYPQVETSLCDLESEKDFEPFANQMDSVVCLNVLEHVGNHQQGLRNMRKVLKPGGKAIVLVPEGPSIYGKLDEALGHFRRYTKAELKQEMEAAGFRVEAVLEFNRVSRPGWYFTGRLLGRDTVSALLLRMFDRLVWLWRRIDRNLPWNPTSIIGIAVKDSATEPLAANTTATEQSQHIAV